MTMDRTVEPEVRAVVFCPLFPPAYLGGGPIRTLEALIRNVPPEFDTHVITSSTDLDRVSPLDVPLDEWVSLGPSSRVRYVSWGSWRAVRDAFIEVRRIRPDFVYLNGFFTAWTIIPQVLIRCRLLPRAQIVLAPRGEFGAAALSMKSRKKRLYLGWYRRLGFARPVIWHASSATESVHIRRTIGPDARVLIRENDTALPPQPARIPPRAEGPLRAVHFARLSPIKGLDVLLEALRLVTSEMALDIYGPEEDEAYAARCRRLAARLPPHVRVAFLGTLPHSRVPDTLVNYDVMLFPTHGENFGHVVAEALSVSCPVIAPGSTPWTDLLRTGGGGLVVEINDADHWARTIEAYARQSARGRTARRHEAAQAYTGWRQETGQRTHLFALIRSELEPRGRG